jgi:hypothetical protein
MNTVQRQFGKLTHRGGGDDAKVSVLLQEFEDADKMLTKVNLFFRPQIDCILIRHRSLMRRSHGETHGYQY